MGLLDKAFSLVTGKRLHEPAGTVHVVDQSPLNWLYITYNTVEELIRVTSRGLPEPAAMKSHRWADDRTLDITVREGNRFPDGEPLTAATVKRAFDEVLRWKSPAPCSSARSSSTVPGCLAFSYWADDRPDRRRPTVLVSRKPSTSANASSVSTSQLVKFLGLRHGLPSVAGSLSFVSCLPSSRNGSRIPQGLATFPR